MLYPDPHSTSSSRKRNLWTLGLGVGAAALILWFIAHDRPPASPDEALNAPKGESVQVPVGMEGDPLNLEKASDLLIDAIIQIESQGDPSMVGSVGERGLMQIRESTWNQVTSRHFGKTLPFAQAFEPEVNRKVGRLYLGDLQEFLYTHRSQWRSDLRSLLLASYNAGPGRVKKSGFDMRKLPPVVQSYATRGSALHDSYLKRNAEAMHDILRAASPETDAP